MATQQDKGKGKAPREPDEYFWHKDPIVGMDPRNILACLASIGGLDYIPGVDRAAPWARTRWSVYLLRAVLDWWRAIPPPVLSALEPVPDHDPYYRYYKQIVGHVLFARFASLRGRDAPCPSPHNENHTFSLYAVGAAAVFYMYRRHYNKPVLFDRERSRRDALIAGHGGGEIDEDVEPAAGSSGRDTADQVMVWGGGGDWVDEGHDLALLPMD